MKKIVILFTVVLLIASCKNQADRAIVIQTDFGLKDGAVAEMKGIAKKVDYELQIFDLTHEIPAYNIWEAAYRLNQVVPYWPQGTVFVSVVDPGVGTARKSVVVLTKTGQYIVTPDNGTLTLVAQTQGIISVREINEKLNRREGSDSSYTFHGRDVYMYTAAKLASGKISFEQVGPEFKQSIVSLAYQPAALQAGYLKGNIPVLDIQYGNVWTNIPDLLIKKAGIRSGDSLDIRIAFKDSLVRSERVVFANSFGDVAEGKPLAYINSLMNFSLAINQGSYAAMYGISNGPGWNIQISKTK